MGVPARGSALLDSAPRCVSAVASLFRACSADDSIPVSTLRAYCLAPFGSARGGCVSAVAPFLGAFCTGDVPSVGTFDAHFLAPLGLANSSTLTPAHGPIAVSARQSAPNPLLAARLALVPVALSGYGGPCTPAHSAVAGGIGEGVPKVFSAGLGALLKPAGHGVGFANALAGAFITDGVT